MILDNIFSFILNLFRFICNFFIDNFIEPIFNKLLEIFPDFSSFMGSVSTYLVDYFFKGITFAKNVFLNVTGYPGPLLRLLVIFFSYKFLVMITFFAVKFALNAWSLVRAGASNHKFINSLSKGGSK